MAKVMISLVGGRPVPNIQAALCVQPSILYLVVSKDSVGEGRDLEKTIAALPDDLKPTEERIVVVAPYLLKDTVDACRRIVSQHTNDELIFNTTLGPKTMAFGAYDVAKELRADGKSVEVCYLGGEGLIWVFRNSIEQVNIGLDQYFASYGWKIKLKSDHYTEKLQCLATLLIHDISVSMRLLSKLRPCCEGKGKRTKRCNNQLTDDEYALLKDIETIGIIANIQRGGGGTTLTICGTEDGEILLGGDWLEYYVYQTAKSLQERGKPLFSECGWGIEDSTGKGELDFVGIIGGQMVAASCKTKPDIQRAWLEELYGQVERLGKGMCSSIFISTVSRCSRTPNQLEDYKKWASERHIVLVLAEDLPNLAEILRKVALVDSRAVPQEIPCYPRI